jgi:hypothetical protein
MLDCEVYFGSERFEDENGWGREQSLWSWWNKVFELKSARVGATMFDWVGKVEDWRKPKA